MEAKCRKKKADKADLKAQIENMIQDLKSANSELESLKADHNNQLQAKESEMQSNIDELTQARAKIEELLKGGDYADEQLRIHIEELEDAVEVLKKGKTKWKDKHNE